MLVTEQRQKAVHASHPAPWIWRAIQAAQQSLVGVRVHIAAEVHSAGLDHLIAGGIDPGADALLAFRAQKLTRRRSRKQVANGLLRVRRRAEATTPGRTAAVPPDAPRLLAAQSVLAVIEKRLRSRTRVEAQGVAILRELLSDPASPLYQADEPGTLASQLRAAAAALV